MAMEAGAINAAHVKMRLFDVRGWFSRDQNYPFFVFDFMTKNRMRQYNYFRSVKVSTLTEDLTAGQVTSAEQSKDPYSQYGTEIPRSIPGTKEYWRSFGLDLVAFAKERGLPTFFLTLTAYDGWPHTQVTLSQGWGATPTEEKYKDLAQDLEEREGVGWYPTVCISCREALQVVDGDNHIS